MSRSTELLRHLRRLSAPRPSGPAGDADLLARFARAGEESAFAALVARHGPMVLAVCRRVLADAHAAEDACQAAFLVLARKAGSLRRPERLAAWLFGVARRVALRSRARRRVPGPVALLPDLADPRPDPLAAVSVREFLVLIDEEVARLPEAYRLPLILCGMEGRSLEEAAHTLGWTHGSVKGRLERGRKRLHARLGRRGLALPGALLAMGLGAAPASATLPTALAAATARAATTFASGAGGNVAGKSVPATLAEATLRGMLAVRLRAAGVLLLAVGLLAGGTGIALRESAAARADADEPRAERPAGPQKASPTAAAPVDRLGDPLPPGAIARMGTVRFRHTDSVNFLALTPDAKLCVSADWSEVRVSEVATGRLFRRIGGDFGTHLRGMCLSPDGKTVLTLSHEGGGLVRVWETASGKELRQFGCDSWSGMALAPDGQTLATYTNAAIRLWDPATGKELRRLAATGQQVQFVTFTPDGRTLISGGDDKTIRFWEIATGREVRQFRDLPLGVCRIVVSPDGKTLAWVGATKITGSKGDGSIYTVGFADRTVYFRDLSTGDDTGSLQCDGPPVDRAFGDPYGVSSLAFSPDGKSLLTAGQDRSVRTWDLATRKERLRWPLSWVGSIAFSKSGELVALGNSAGVVFRNPSGKGTSPTLPGHYNCVNAAAFSPGGDTLASAAADGTIRLWEPATGAERRCWQAHPISPESLAWSPDGRALVSAGRAAIANGRDDPVLYIWDPATGREIRRLDAGEPASRPAVSPDGRLVACRVGERSVRVWELETGREVGWMAAGDTVVCLAFSPDSQSVLAWDKDKKIRIWDLKGKPQPRVVATNFPDVPTGAAFSPDTRLLAAVGQRQITLFDTASGREVRRVTSLTDSALRIEFSPDGRTLAAGDFWKSTTSLFEVSTGRLRKQFAGQSGRIYALAFAPDGTTLTSGGSDSALLVWDTLAPPDGWRGPPILLGDGDLARYWDDLSDADGTTAYRALTRLSLAPEQSVPYLARRLHPATALRPEERRRIVRLIAELDAEEFDVREKATAELKRLGEQAEPALRAALTESPTHELLQRAESLLRELEQSPEGKERLRLSRALEILERASTPAARRALAEMSGGEAEARLTREAKESLERLTVRTGRVQQPVKP
jgi:RNA polymerase sigma factor (sigma-70 family)